MKYTILRRSVMNPLMVSMGAGMQQNLPANALGGQGATNIFGDVFQ